ncbi:hypothetical protein ABH937_006654 [Kitasatospora sp. GAS1066B]
MPGRAPSNDIGASLLECGKETLGAGREPAWHGKVEIGGKAGQCETGMGVP